MEKHNKTIMEKSRCTHDFPGSFVRKQARRSQIFDEQQNIISVVVVTTSLLVNVAATLYTNQPTMIDDATTKKISSYTF
jgi:hypothetical protein